MQNPNYIPYTCHAHLLTIEYYAGMLSAIIDPVPDYDDVDFVWYKKEGGHFQQRESGKHFDTLGSGVYKVEAIWGHCKLSETIEI